MVFLFHSRGSEARNHYLPTNYQSGSEQPHLYRLLKYRRCTWRENWIPSNQDQRRWHLWWESNYPQYSHQMCNSTSELHIILIYTLVDSIFFIPNIAAYVFNDLVTLWVYTLNTPLHFFWTNVWYLDVLAWEDCFRYIINFL